MNKNKQTTKQGTWFNAYGDVDDYLIQALSDIGEEFPIIDRYYPQNNTIAAIKLLVKKSK